MRPEIQKLIALGRFPSENLDNPKLEDHVNIIAGLLESIKQPVTDQEAMQLVKLFGDDSCFGVAWTLLHLIETAPNWPIIDCLPKNSNNEWIKRLRRRSEIDE